MPWIRRLSPTLLLLAVVACSGSGATQDNSADSTAPTSSAPSSTKPPDPPPPAPEVGECRKLDFTDISRYSNDSEQVKCSKEHTAYTYEVQEIPKAVAVEGVEIQNDAVQAAAAKKCQSSFAGFIGGDAEARALTRLTVTYFLPNQKGFDAGAHWVRCDVVAAQGPNALAPLPNNLEGFLENDDATADFGVCSQGDPGSKAVLVMCAQDHTYRAVAAFSLGKAGSPYPGVKETLNAGKQDCQDFIADLLGVSGGFTYSWTYPSSSEWDAGQRFGYCWNQTDK